MIKKILYNLKDIESFFEDFNWKIFAYDTETTDLRLDRLEITGISFCDGNKACYIPIDSSKNIMGFPCVKKEVIKEFLIKNSNKINHMIAHNCVFDGKVLYNIGFFLNDYDNIHMNDTMVMAHLFDENLPSKGLKQLTEKFFGIKPVKFDEVKTNHYTKQFFEYGCDDAVNTFNLFKLLLQKLKEKDLLILYLKTEVPFQKCLLEMKVEGVDINKEFLDKTTETLKKELEKTELDMCKELDVPVSMEVNLFGEVLGIKHKYNFSSAKQLSDILFNVLGLEIIERTPTGQPQTGKFTIAKYKKDVPFVALLNKYKIITKLYTAFFVPLSDYIQDDGRIRPEFSDVGTVTGRLSSYSPNCQQLPKPNPDFPIETRECFTVPKGYKMFSVDYSGQELRVMAHLTKEPGMITSFNKNSDLHLSVANDVWNLGIPEECLQTDNPEYEMYKKKFKKERNNAKAVNFGLAYGISAYGLSDQIGCSEDEAQAIINDYFSKYSNIKKAIDNTHNEVKNQGYVKNLFGRYRRFTKINGKYYGKGDFRQSFNFKIQGSSADMIRKAAINSFKTAKQHKEWDLKMIMTVHDEIVFKIKEEFVEEGTKAVKECFENAVELCIPLISDVEVGDNYGNAK